MKCPLDSIHITAYRVTGHSTATLMPCGHAVMALLSETSEPRSVATYGTVNSTTPGQRDDTHLVMPSN